MYSPLPLSNSLFNLVGFLNTNRSPGCFSDKGDRGNHFLQPLLLSVYLILNQCLLSTPRSRQAFALNNPLAAYYKNTLFADDENEVRRS